MSIREKHEEILRLIDRLSSNRHSGGVQRKRAAPEQRGLRKRRSRKTATRGSQYDQAFEARRRQLVDIIERRERLEESLSDPAVSDRLTTLEERIVGLERKLGQGGPNSSGRGLGDSGAALDHTLGGTLRSGLLPDLLQLVSSNVLSGVFVVTQGDRELNLYFHEGEIVHADGPDVTGESAVFAVMGLESGTYKFTETAKLPVERTIESKTQFLILEGLRRADEEQVGSSA